MCTHTSRSPFGADSDVLEIVVDTGKARRATLPTITIEDADEGNVPDGQSHNDVPETPNSPTWPSSPTSPTSPEAPGAMPTGPAPEIPDWYKVGWRDVSGIDRSGVKEGELKDKAILDQFLSEQFYGEWYHNAAMIVTVSVVLHMTPVMAHSPRPGRSHNAFPYPVPFWYGLDIHHPSILQHLLFHLHGAHPAAGARRYPT